MRCVFGTFVLMVVLMPSSAVPETLNKAFFCGDMYQDHYSSVQALFVSNWVTPEGLQGIECVVEIDLDDSGLAARINFTYCPSDDALRDSVKQAISDTGPVPIVDIEECRAVPLEITFRSAVE